MRVFAALCLSLSLSACGGIYNSPHVIEQDTAVGTVRVAEITAESVTEANKSPYRPRALPAQFRQTTASTGTVDRALHLPPPYQPGPYKIGVGDVIQYTSTNMSPVTMDPTSGLPIPADPVSRSFMVQDDGSISIPDIGRVHIAGLSIDDAESDIYQMLSRSQAQPSFSIEISGFKSQYVRIDGAVRLPGAVPITLVPITLSDALVAVGGAIAIDTDSTVIRLSRDGASYTIPMSAYLTSPQVQSITMKDGDTIVVDTSYLLRQTKLSETRSNYLTSNSLGAIARDYVYITGEVGSQSRYTLPFEQKASLADALYEKSGGIPNSTGSISELYVLRSSDDGEGVTAWHLNAINAANLVLATRFELRPNDIVFVAEQPVTSLSRLISQLSPSLYLGKSLTGL